jgi:hypothetical protein
MWRDIAVISHVLLICNFIRYQQHGFNQPGGETGRRTQENESIIVGRFRRSSWYEGSFPASPLAGPLPESFT